MLIDGNSLTYRAFHALPQDLATSTGQPTNAVLGFTSMLINLARDHQPDSMAVAFDRPEPTFRHKKVATYKANRSETPSLLLQQFGLVREVLQALAIPQIEKVGIEADDIIATLATEAAEEGTDVLIVTGDRDSYQLVEDPHIKVVYNKRGVSDYALYDEAGIKEKTGVAPQSYVHYAALRGDPSDNLPGVPGVGEKTAARLITKYGDVATLYKNLDEQTPKLRQNLLENEENANLNVLLMDLQRDADLPITAKDLLQPNVFDPEKVKEVFDFLEFRNLYPRFAKAFSVEEVESSPKQPLEVTLSLIESSSALKKFCEQLVQAAKPVAVGVAGESKQASKANFDTLTLATAGEPTVAVFSQDVLDMPEAIKSLSSLCGDTGPGIITNDSKPLVRSLAHKGIQSPNIVLDTALAAYLLDPAGDNGYEISTLLQEHTDWAPPSEDAVPEGQLAFGETENSQRLAQALQTRALSELYEPMSAAIKNGNLTALLEEMEIPLAKTLSRMEKKGVRIDRAALEALNKDFIRSSQDLAKEIQEIAGEEFNVNSTKKLQEILFQKLELKPQKKTKTGFSTNQATLEKLRGEHPIIELLLRYREVEKLRSTYGQALLDCVEDDERIHATFPQTVARTGRLSSENPNLHNIPIRSDLGKNFRKVFVAPEDSELLVSDYNQIELRCIAHLANDPGLIEAFANNVDVHQMTAARIFGVSPEEVTAEQRSRSKMVSYGLAYGMEAYGLSQRLRIPTKEAQTILDAFFVNFPAIKEYMDSTIEQARNRGYTETLFGRRRAIPELMSDNRNVRMAAERQAMNAGIQGLAADIFKVALVTIDAALLDQGLQSRLVLQVHDEVILEVPIEEKKEAESLVSQKMQNAFDLAVPLEVNLSFAKTWAGAKG